MNVFATIHLSLFVITLARLAWLLRPKPARPLIILRLIRETNDYPAKRAA